MNRKLHAYDVCLESLDVNGSVSALKLYGPRGLNQAEGGFLTLESIAEDTKAQVRYLRQLGINKKPARLIVIPDNDQGLTSSALEHKTEIKKQISALGITHLEPFMHGDKAQELADALELQTPYKDRDSAHRIVEASNNKSKILTYFSDRNLAVPKGKPIQDLPDAIHFFEQLLSEGFPAVFVKIVRSASGDGTCQVNTLQELVTLLDHPRFAQALNTGNIYIDGLIPYTQSPSVLMDIFHDGTFDVIGSNYQMLGKKTPEDIVPTVHLGARGPISTEHYSLMHDHVLATADFLHQTGYIGTANIEGVLYNDKFYAIEINARQTGASTPSKESRAIEQLSQTQNHWYCNNNFKVPENTDYNEIIACLYDLLYNRSKKQGVVISNFAILRKGKCQLTIHAPSRGLLDDYIQETTHRLKQLTI